MLKVKTDLGCRLYVDDEFKGIARAGIINKFVILKGEYWVRFESLTDSTIFTEKAVSIPDWDVLEVIQFRPLMHRFVLIPFQKNELWGYAELFSGMEIVAPVYSSAEEFSNGYAVVRKGDRFGLVADDGTEALPCLYEEIKRIWDNSFIIESDKKFALFNPSVPSKLSSFYDEWDYVWDSDSQVSRNKEEGVIVVKKNDLCGLYDCFNNRELLPCEYKRIAYPRIGGQRLAINQDSWTILTRDCKPIGMIPDSSRYTDFGCSGEYVFLKSDGKWGIFDLKGNVVVPCRFDTIADSFHNGLIWVGQRQLRDGKWVMNYGFVNEKGDVIIPCIYDYALGFINDITFVSLYEKEKWTSRFRDLFINKQGEIISEIKDVITSIFPFYKGVALCKRKSGHNDMYCMISENGTVIRDIDPHFPINDERYYGRSNDWTSEFFDNGFHEVTSGGYTYYDEDDILGVSSYDVPFTFGVVGIDGKMIVPTKYSELRNVDFIFTSFDKNGRLMKTWIPNSERAVICTNEQGLSGLLGRDGKEIIPCRYSNIWISIDEITLKTMAWVEKDGKIALFNSKTGEQITPFKYDRTMRFYSGKAFVIEDGQVAVIDETGTIISTSYSLTSEHIGTQLCRVSVDSGVALLSIDNLRLYPSDKKFDSFFLENGLIRLISHSIDGHHNKSWNSEMILDAQTGLEYLPETTVKLTIKKENTSFLAQL